MVHAQIVVESMFGNTRAIADAVAEGLREHGVDVDVDTPDPATPHRPGELLVVLGPTHTFSMSRPATRQDAARQGATGPVTAGIREWIETLPATGAGGYACADTRVSRWIPGSAARAAHRALRRRGLRPIVGPRSFLVSGNGPLRPGELDRARWWGHTLAASVPTTGSAR